MARLWLYDIVGSATEPRTDAQRPRRARLGCRVLAAVLLIVGSVGAGSVATDLSGHWQVLLFAVSLVAVAAGLVLTCTGRP